jgi:hypothetical protein
LQAKYNINKQDKNEKVIDDGIDGCLHDSQC